MIQHYQCRNCCLEIESEDSNGRKCPECGQDMWWVAALGIPKGDSQEFYSQELGLLGPQQQNWRNSHPSDEFDKLGRMKIRNYRHLNGVLKEKGMEILSDSKKYNEYQEKLHEEARTIKNEK